MEMAPDFDECIGFLTAHGVEFVVVGAYALAFHGARGVRLSCQAPESRNDIRPSADAPDGRATGSDPRHERHQRG